MKREEKRRENKVNRLVCILLELKSYIYKEELGIQQ